MFKWDGSDLTEFLKRKDVRVEEGIYEKLILWRFYWNEDGKRTSQLCIVRSCQNILPCLIDEIKPVFNIEKLGTHWTRYKSRRLLLIKPHLSDDVLIEDLPLNIIVNATSNVFIKSEVRKIFLFKEIMGATRSSEKSIVLRNNGILIKPISWYEPGMKPVKDAKVISNSVLKKWFDDTDMDREMMKFLQISQIADITKLLFQLRNKMEKIVKRIDITAISYVDAILYRIQSRLQHILDI